ncbi:MAG: TetR/AcrR family transcriptional regulator [Lachnospiraceae bacterium]|nr:TetR/AcrR family transcriptional regulator [Lachnospiraceae bacterium]
MSVRDTSIDPRLLQSAREEFMKKGFIKADLKTICDNAGVTTGAVYKRYKGKEELFGAVVSDTLAVLDEMIESRTDIDLSVLSDDEIRNMWFMNEEYTLGMFGVFWNVRDDLFLLLSRSSGTIYENYGHEFADRMTESYMKYYREAVKRGIAKADIKKKEMHILCTSFWVSIYEPFIHRMSRKEIEEHCKIICRYFDWASCIGIK